ncbi:hypothetical protein [Nocardia sp. No.11]|uniref:hypothetical protein n=1 Tax=Nocardia sp. No.11 TaxID=3128861 RepID=UPI00319DB854
MTAPADNRARRPPTRAYGVPSRNALGTGEAADAPARRPERLRSQFSTATSARLASATPARGGTSGTPRPPQTLHIP